MIDYVQQPSALQKLTGTIELSAEQAAVIKQTYVLLGVSIFCALAGGYVGATTPTIVNFFSTRIGWVVAILMLNAVPMIARAAQNNPVLGVTALVANGFVAGIAMAPLLWVASTYDPQLIYVAFAVTACVFLRHHWVRHDVRSEFLRAPRNDGWSFSRNNRHRPAQQLHAHRVARYRCQLWYWRARRLRNGLLNQFRPAYASRSQSNSRRAKPVRRNVQCVRSNA